MNELVRVMKNALRQELLVAKEFIENELHRLGEEGERLVPRNAGVGTIPKPEHYANGER